MSPVLALRSCMSFRMNLPRSLRVSGLKVSFFGIASEWQYWQFLAGMPAFFASVSICGVASARPTHEASPRARTASRHRIPGVICVPPLAPPTRRLLVLPAIQRLEQRHEIRHLIRLEHGPGRALAPRRGCRDERVVPERCHHARRGVEPLVPREVARRLAPLAEDR